MVPSSGMHIDSETIWSSRMRLACSLDCDCPEHIPEVCRLGLVLDGVWLLSSSTAKKIMSSMVVAQLEFNMLVLNQGHVCQTE